MDDRRSELPHAPIAHVCVKTYGAMEDGVPLITPDCVTFKELDISIDELIRELEEIRKKARRKFVDDYRRQIARAATRK